MPYLSTRNLALAIIFGVMIFIFETLLPTPMDKAFTFFQAMLLSLGYLLIGVPGATFISLIGGSLTAVWRAPLAPFTLGFALLFGGLIDVFCLVFGARDRNGNVRQKRLILAVALSTMITGYSGYYITITFKIMELDPALGNVILIAGIISGIVGGYLSLILWKRILRKDSAGRDQ
ncbi:MAG: hypothetical protein JSW14_01815 [Candidatus Bathyarchaeum sp.]|nr:MAG: hypothetical protein JSW14_01815 [Candidatus Bathyarchaeum sp.]